MRMANLLASSVALTLVAGAALASPQNYNGTWSVRLMTEAGKCDPFYSTTVTIRDGQIQSNANGTSVSGGVGTDGRVALGIQRSIATGDASGRLAARSGTGTWRVAMLGCTGRWTAQKHTLTAQTE